MSIQTTSEFTAGVAGVYTEHLAAGLGGLMPDLDASFPADPIPRDRLEHIITSPDYDQLVVVQNGLATPDVYQMPFDEVIARGKIVGAATMSIVRGAGFGERGQLEDFVTAAELQGQGLGTLAWNAMAAWCRDRGLRNFYFQTETDRPDAVKFYDRRGALHHPESLHYEMVVDGRQ